MIQIKLIKQVDEDKNLPFEDTPSEETPHETRLLFIIPTA